MAKQSFNWNIVGWIAFTVLAIVFVNKIGNLSLGNSVVSLNQTIINEVPLNPEKINPSYSVSLVLTPVSVCAGDNVLGIISSNIPSGFCSIYVNTGSGFTHLKIVNLDGNGRYSENNVFSTVGTAQVRSICCDAGMNCKASNEVTLTVRDCGSSTSCVDSDGKNAFSPGRVTSDLYYYDDCAGNWAVTEYFCEGNIVKSQVMSCGAGFICYETRSGDYCKPTSVPPVDSDGDGVSDADEISAGTDPNNAYDYPNSPLNNCANHCKDIGYAGATIHATSSASCELLSRNYCAEESLPFDYSTYSSSKNCCCYDCVGW